MTFRREHGLAIACEQAKATRAAETALPPASLC
jgi:hypothetical protein